MSLDQPVPSTPYNDQVSQSPTVYRAPSALYEAKGHDIHRQA